MNDTLRKSSTKNMHALSCYTAKVHNICLLSDFQISTESEIGNVYIFTDYTIFMQHNQMIPKQK